LPFDKDLPFLSHSNEIGLVPFDSTHDAETKGVLVSISEGNEKALILGESKKQNKLFSKVKQILNRI